MTLRSLVGRHQSRQPAAGATQAVTPAADLPLSCHFASEKAKLVETTPSGFHGFLPAAAYVQHSRRAVT
jgi:hypothetical protein